MAVKESKMPSVNSLLNTISDVATSLKLTGTCDFPESGVVQIEDELISYGHATDDGLVLLGRGYAGTVSAEHLAKVPVTFLRSFAVNSDKFSPLSLTDPASLGAGDVDHYNYFLITTTSPVALTVPAPTSSTGQVITFLHNDSSTSTLTVNTATIDVGKIASLCWDGTAWLPVMSPTPVIAPLSITSAMLAADSVIPSKVWQGFHQTYTFPYIVAVPTVNAGNNVRVGTNGGSPGFLSIIDGSNNPVVYLTASSNESILGNSGTGGHAVTINSALDGFPLKVSIPQIDPADNDHGVTWSQKLYAPATNQASLGLYHTSAADLTCPVISYVAVGDPGFTRVVNVGIGNEQPNALLHVGSSTSPNYSGFNIQLEAPLDDRAYFSIKEPSTEFQIYRDQGAAWIGGDSPLHFMTGSGWDSRVIIDNDGNVGIGNETPVAKLDIASTTQGVLLPRMTTAERDLISTPAEGLIIYNLDTHVLNFFNGTIWAVV
jgi:hypothetical protein